MYKHIKGILSGLRQFLGTENPLKMMKNAFYFTLVNLFSFCVKILVMQKNPLLGKVLLD